MHDQVPAQLLDSLSRSIAIIDQHIRQPVRRQVAVLMGHFHDAPNGPFLPPDLKLRVFHSGRLGWLHLPGEKGLVELFRRFGIPGREFAPAEGAGAISEVGGPFVFPGLED